MVSSNSGSSGPNMARRKAAWSSCNAGIAPLLGTLHKTLGCVGFSAQHSQFWDISVPLDQGGHWAKAGQGVAVEGPDRIADWRAMIIDQDRLAVSVIYGVPGEMDFTYSRRRQGREIGHGVAPKIAATHVDVVDIAQESTTRTPHQLLQKRRLRDCGVDETQVTRWILDEEAALQDLLGMHHMLGNDLEGLLRV